MKKIETNLNPISDEASEVKSNTIKVTRFVHFRENCFYFVHKNIRTFPSLFVKLIILN